MAGHANADGIDISIQNVSPVGRRTHELAVSIRDTRGTNDIFCNRDKFRSCLGRSCRQRRLVGKSVFQQFVLCHFLRVLPGRCCQGAIPFQSIQAMLSPLAVQSFIQAALQPASCSFQPGLRAKHDRYGKNACSNFTATFHSVPSQSCNR